MRLTEFMRDAAENISDHSLDTLSNLLVAAADTIDSQNVYKLKWAEIADKYSRLEKEYETLLAKNTRKKKDDH